MKEGWTYKKLGEVASYINGYAFKPSDWEDNGMPIIRIQNLTGTQNSYHRCNRKDIPSKYIVRKGDILISWSATLGVYEWTIEDALLNQHIFKVVFDKQKINKDYFRYAVLTSIEEMSKHTNGATMKHIRKGDFDNICIPIPSIEEQQRIVSRLDSAFAHIDELKANAEKQLAEAQTLFQKSLAKAMKPKEGWEEKILKEVTSSIGDGLHGTPMYSDDGDYFFVNGNNFEDGVIEIKDNTKRVNSDEYNKYKINLDETTVLLSINGTIGKTAFYNGEPIILGKSACYINVLPSLLKEFLRYFLLSDNFIEYAKYNSRQATIVNLGLKEIRTMPIPLPPLTVQQRIVERLDALSENIRKYEEIQRQIISECDALKQALLRQVFE